MNWLRPLRCHVHALLDIQKSPHRLLKYSCFNREVITRQSYFVASSVVLLDGAITSVGNSGPIDLSCLALFARHVQACGSTAVILKWPFPAL